MESQSLSLEISPAIGNVSAECIVPEKAKCIITLAHGAGAGMNHSFMVTLAKSLSEAGIATMRFNFPFTENKKGRPDPPAVAHKTIEASISKAKELFPELPLFVAGKSFGGRMTSQYLSAHHDVRKRDHFLWLSIASSRQTLHGKSRTFKRCKDPNAVFTGNKR